MDPNKTLAGIREAATDMGVSNTETEFADAAFRLRDAITGLDTWVTGGGFLPNEWFQARMIAGRG